jgi:hypothetical protein
MERFPLSRYHYSNEAAFCDIGTSRFPTAYDGSDEHPAKCWVRKSKSEVNEMGFGGFGGDNCCIWIILIIVVLCCCCNN